VDSASKVANLFARIRGGLQCRLHGPHHGDLAGRNDPLTAPGA